MTYRQASALGTHILWMVWDPHYVNFQGSKQILGGPSIEILYKFFIWPPGKFSQRPSSIFRGLGLSKDFFFLIPIYTSVY